MIAVVDSGPLYAVVDTDDAAHIKSLAIFQRRDLELVIPALVVAEVTYMVGRRLGAVIEARFLAGLAEYDIQAPAPDEWKRIAELVEQYGDWPLGGTDASVVALAERLRTPMVVTLDRRHFAPIKPKHCSSFQLLP